MLIDVRTPEEYSMGHIKGAVNIPVSDLDEGHFGELALVERDAELQLYCRSGARAAYACALLQSAGFTNAVNIGGLEEAMEVVAG